MRGGCGASASLCRAWTDGRVGPRGHGAISAPARRLEGMCPSDLGHPSTQARSGSCRCGPRALAPDRHARSSSTRLDPVAEPLVRVAPAGPAPARAARALRRAARGRSRSSPSPSPWRSGCPTTGALDVGHGARARRRLRARPPGALRRRRRVRRRRRTSCSCRCSSSCPAHARAARGRRRVPARHGASTSLVRGAHPERAIVAVANGVVRGRAGARLRARPARRSRRWPSCVVAFAAQLAADLAASTTREWLCSAIPPHFQARVIGLIAVVDGAAVADRPADRAGGAARPAAHAARPAAGRAARAGRPRARPRGSSQVRSQTDAAGAGHAPASARPSPPDSTATRRLAIAVDAAIDVTEATTGPRHPRARRRRRARLRRERGVRRTRSCCAAPSAQRSRLTVQVEAAGRAVDRDRRRRFRRRRATTTSRRIVLSVARPDRPFTADERERFRGARPPRGGVRGERRAPRAPRAPGDDGRAHGAAQPPRACTRCSTQEIEPALAVPPARSRWSCSTSTTSSASTTRTATSAATRCCTTVARAVESAAREGDHVARYGGEELAVVLPHAELAQAQRRRRAHPRADRGASRSQLPDGRSIRPTASLGVAALAGQRRQAGADRRRRRRALRGQAQRQEPHGLRDAAPRRAPRRPRARLTPRVLRRRRPGATAGSPANLAPHARATRAG